MDMIKARHPAKYTDSLLPVFAEMAQGCKSILDPMAGTGKIFKLRNYGITADIKAIELEPEFAAWHPETQIGNALALPFADESIECVIVSPTYANRMADSHTAKDSSHRNTYTHAIGRKLHPDNSGQLQWGNAYRDFHCKAWREVYRVLQPNGIFILNIKDHIRKSRVIRVTLWHCLALGAIGFREIESRKIDCPGNRFGKNGEKRINYESVIKFAKEVKNG